MSRFRKGEKVQDARCTWGQVPSFEKRDEHGKQRGKESKARDTRKNMVRVGDGRHGRERLTSCATQGVRGGKGKPELVCVVRAV